MRFIADLPIHFHFSRATLRLLVPEKVKQALQQGC
jgi:hypothetical protein